jgi:hypothetical protein
MRPSITMLELVPVGIVLSIAAITASATYFVQCRATPGRTRGAVAYQAGFLMGLGTTFVIGSVLTAFAQAVVEDTPIAEAGMLAAFLGPFAGMVHAELRALVQGASVAT